MTVQKTGNIQAKLEILMINGTGTVSPNLPIAITNKINTITRNDNIVPLGDSFPYTFVVRYGITHEVTYKDKDGKDQKMTTPYYDTLNKEQDDGTVHLVAKVSFRKETGGNKNVDFFVWSINPHASKESILFKYS